MLGGASEKMRGLARKCAKYPLQIFSALLYYLHMETTAVQKFIEALQTRQRDAGLNDTQFARLLSVDISLWHKVVRGRIPIGLTIIQAAARTYPEIDSAAVLLLPRSERIFSPLLADMPEVAR